MANIDSTSSDIALFKSTLNELQASKIKDYVHGCKLIQDLTWEAQNQMRHSKIIAELILEQFEIVSADSRILIVELISSIMYFMDFYSSYFKDYREHIFNVAGEKADHDGQSKLIELRKLWDNLIFKPKVAKPKPVEKVLSKEYLKQKEAFARMIKQDRMKRLEPSMNPMQEQSSLNQNPPKNNNQQST